MPFLDLFNFDSFRWTACPPCPIARTEGSGIQLGSQFYIFGGFHTIDHVLGDAHVFDLEHNRWIDQFPMPPNMGHTHIGLAKEADRFIYSVAGQKGPQCSPAIADCVVLDTRTKEWNSLPPLPEVRYAPIVHFWNGRLHALGGSKKDRVTPALDHWSLAVDQGKALEPVWRAELPVPKGGPHSTGIMIDGSLYIFGGELGDVKAVDGDPEFKCDWHTPMEIVYGDSFRLSALGAPWEPLAPMPSPSTHMESSIFRIGDHVVISGGNRARDKLSNLIQAYDLRSNTWKQQGHLPYCMKTTTAYYNGWFYILTGQRGRNAIDPDPGQVMDNVWRMKFSL